MEITRRDMFSVGGKLLLIASVGATFEQITGAEPQPDAYRMADHWWGMIIDIDKCIGCGSCVRAYSNENQVPKHYFRTWVERYEVPEGYVNPGAEIVLGDLDYFRTWVERYEVPEGYVNPRVSS